MLNNGTIKNKAPDKQVVLPFVKSLEIAIKSIKSRFFRSLITTMSLILAISFYSYIKINADVANAVFLSKDTLSINKLYKQGYEMPDDVAGEIAGETGGENRSTRVNPKERWILFLSLLVCVVGIVNTQLMAVTERFREIGTMKCLGALDRFILRLFLIEAALQGLIGASIGAIIGVLIALSVSLVKFDSHVFIFLKLSDIGLTLTSSIALGCFLSILGVLYPALLAARMQPVEAMKGKD